MSGEKKGKNKNKPRKPYKQHEPQHYNNQPQRQPNQYNQNQPQHPHGHSVPHPQLQHLPYVGADFPFGLMSFKAPLVVVDPTVKYLPPVRPQHLPARGKGQQGNQQQHYGHQQQSYANPPPNYNPGASLSLSHSGGSRPNQQPQQHHQQPQQHHQQQAYSAPAPLNQHVGQQFYQQQQQNQQGVPYAGSSLPVPPFLGSIGQPHNYSGAGLVEDVRSLDHYQHYSNPPEHQQQQQERTPKQGRKKERIYPGMPNPKTDQCDAYNNNNNSHESQPQQGNFGNSGGRKQKQFPKSPNPQFQEYEHSNNHNYNDGGNYDNNNHYGTPNRKNNNKQYQSQPQNAQSHQGQQSRSGKKQNQHYPGSPQQSYSQQHSHSTPEQFHSNPQHQNQQPFYTSPPPNSGRKNRNQHNDQQYFSPNDGKGRNNGGNYQASPSNFTGGKRGKQGGGGARGGFGDHARSPGGDNRAGREPYYDDYYTLEKVQQQKLPVLYEASLRVNPFDRFEAYATIEGFRQDVLIKGFKNQNRAFDGDVVIVEVFPQDQWVYNKDDQIKFEKVQRELLGVQDGEDELLGVRREESKSSADSSDSDEQADAERIAPPKLDLDGSDVVGVGDEESDAPRASDKATGTPQKGGNANRKNGENKPRIFATIHEYNASRQVEPREKERMKAKVQDLALDLRPTGKVVYIKEANSAERQFVGFFQLVYEKADKKPTDELKELIERASRPIVAQDAIPAGEYLVLDNSHGGPRKVDVRSALLQSNLLKPEVVVAANSPQSKNQEKIVVSDLAGKHYYVPASKFVDPSAAIEQLQKHHNYRFFLVDVLDPNSPGDGESNGNLTSEASATPNAKPEAHFDRGAKSVERETKKRGQEGKGQKKGKGKDGKDQLSMSKLLFFPMDKRAPVFSLSLFDSPGACPADLITNFSKYENTYFVVKFSRWDRQHVRPKAKFVKLLGTAGDIIVESKAILESNSIDYAPFSPKLLEGISEKFVLTAHELATRKDCRLHRIFSIDPLTAKDLDDALHITALPNGHFEVGVHIADVSYYIQPGSELDKMARGRANSCYLVQECIPMLPHLLSETLCSLNAGVERFAFSIIWELDEQGEIVPDTQWIGRTVIKSVAKLAYQHAQMVLDDFARGEKDGAGLAELKARVTAGTRPEDVAMDIVHLDRLAKQMRRRRFENGAMNFNRAKLRFTIDENKNPTAFHLDKSEDSNKLIEEYMLLANMKVAEFIHEAFPNNALLRRHEEPKGKKRADFLAKCEELGVDIDLTSSKTFYETLKSLPERYDIPYIVEIMSEYASKCQTAAEYFCSGTLDPEDYHHYALSTDCYTHFTSPIRRYSDVVVHRLLFSALEKRMFGVEAQETIRSIAEKCNYRKRDAKRAGSDSEDLYLAIYLRDHPLIDQECVVYQNTSVKNDCLYVYSPILGQFYRVFITGKDEGQDGKKNGKEAPKPATLTITLGQAEPVANNTNGGEPVAKKEPRKASDFPMFSTVPIRFTKRMDCRQIEIRADLVAEEELIAVNRTCVVEQQSPVQVSKSVVQEAARTAVTDEVILERKRATTDAENGSTSV